MFRNVLVAIDIDDKDGWWKILHQALDCVDREEGKIRLLYVRSDLPTSWRDFAPPDFDTAEQDRCEAKLADIARLVDFPPKRISWVVRMGSVHNEALREAESCRADMIVAGPHRTSFSGFLLGSSASAIVRHASVAVLVVR